MTPADKTAIITLAKTFEKRRCDHSPDEPPLSTPDCLSSVIDPKDSKTNKHHYVIAVQDATLREWARSIRGVPSIFVRRSVMILEPMAEVSMNVREGAEREKLRAGVKRKRGDGNDDKPRVEKRKEAVNEDAGKLSTLFPSYSIVFRSRAFMMNKSLRLEILIPARRTPHQNNA